MAEVGWIHFSKEDMKKVGTVLDSLTPEGMVDELGIGVVRDVVADQLFPGISTIQTRAKYFFIIPYILLDYQKLSPLQKQRKAAKKFLDDIQDEIMWALAERYNHDIRGGSGVIGISKYPKDQIMRRPSEIYWNGLNTFDILRTGDLGINSFLNMRTKSSVEGLISSIKTGDEDLGDDIDSDFNNIFKINKVPYTSDWREDVDIILTKEEADFLYDQIIEKCKRKLLSELLENNHLYELFCAAGNFMNFAKAAIESGHLDSKLESEVILAHDFSELMYGPHIMYNILLQEKKFPGKSYHKDIWEDWLTNLHTNMIDYEGFNPASLFLPPYYVSKNITKNFILEFWDLIKTGNIGPIKQLVTGQEYRNKGSKARLIADNIDDVMEDKWLGLTRLNYRYPNVKRILEDIVGVRENA